jgi:glycosyl hydrolase family 134
VLRFKCSAAWPGVKAAPKADTADVATKQIIQSNAGGTIALAIAMLENATLSSDYPFGDCKIGWAANFGVFKMNWYMICQCRTAARLISPDFVFNGSPTETNGQNGEVALCEENRVGTIINADAAIATMILNEAMEKWSTAAPMLGDLGNFWAGHRWGESGLRNLAAHKDWPITRMWSDIQLYYRSVQWAKCMCDHDPCAWTTAVRYGAIVPPV